MDEEPDVPEVRPPTIDDSRRICRALDEAGAHYVLIGGFAVILHGGPSDHEGHRPSRRPGAANVERLKRALAVLEDDAAREIEAGDLQKYTVVRVADEVLVDLLAAACGVTWLEARASALRMDLEGTPVIVTDIRTKMTVRPSDAADRAWLESLREGSGR